MITSRYGAPAGGGDDAAEDRVAEVGVLERGARRPGEAQPAGEQRVEVGVAAAPCWRSPQGSSVGNPAAIVSRVRIVNGAASAVGGRTPASAGTYRTASSSSASGALVTQQQDRRRREALGHRRDAEHGVGVRHRRGPAVRRAAPGRRGRPERTSSPSRTTPNARPGCPPSAAKASTRASTASTRSAERSADLDTGRILARAPPGRLRWARPERMPGMSGLLDGLLSAPPAVVYVLVGLLVFGEAAVFVGFVLPGETAVVLGGVLASRHEIELWALIVLVALCAVIGDTRGVRGRPSFRHPRPELGAAAPPRAAARRRPGASCAGAAGRRCSSAGGPRSCARSCRGWRASARCRTGGSSSGTRSAASPGARRSASSGISRPTPTRSSPAGSAPAARWSPLVIVVAALVVWHVRRRRSERASTESASAEGEPDAVAGDEDVAGDARRHA